MSGVVLRSSGGTAECPECGTLNDTWVNPLRCYKCKTPWRDSR